jgi:hypothetical protein
MTIIGFEAIERNAKVILLQTLDFFFLPTFSSCKRVQESPVQRVVLSIYLLFCVLSCVVKCPE